MGRNTSFAVGRCPLASSQVSAKTLNMLYSSPRIETVSLIFNVMELLSKGEEK